MKPAKLSRFLSLVLRHKPDEINLKLDDQGWTDLTHLVERLNATGKKVSLGDILTVVASSEKQRFTLSEDQTQIRAAQGHSIAVELGIPPSTPPEWLYHGTATRFLDSIQRKGLNSRSRQHVHLLEDSDAAWSVGMRHGEPVLLTIDAQRMHQAGHTFFKAENGVWLTKEVPVEFLDRY